MPPKAPHADDPLATLLTTPRHTTQGSLCGVAVFANKLNIATQAVLEQVLLTDHKHRTVADVMSGMGNGRISTDTVGRHRRGQCSCGDRPDGWDRGRRG